MPDALDKVALVLGVAELSVIRLPDVPVQLIAPEIV